MAVKGTLPQTHNTPFFQGGVAETCDKNSSDVYGGRAAVLIGKWPCKQAGVSSLFLFFFYQPKCIQMKKNKVLSEPTENLVQEQLKLGYITLLK